MIDERAIVSRAVETLAPPEPSFDRLVHRRDRVRRDRRIRAGVLGMALVVGAGWWAIDAIRFSPIPANPSDPTAENPFARVDGEVLRFTRVDDLGDLPEGSTAPGQLIAVDPRTGEERVLLEDLDSVYSARWSGDGQWLAYETGASDGGRELWVVGGSQPPRVVAAGANPIGNVLPQNELEWRWAPTGAELATIEHSETLRTIDVATGETTDLGTVVADLLPISGIPRPWAWSPDRTSLVFGSPIGAPEAFLTSVNLRTGARSQIATLPGFEFVERIRWSPDGAHIAVQMRASDGGGPLYVMNADGSDIRVVTRSSDSFGFAWSPDGASLAFASEFGSDSGLIRIGVAAADGSAPVGIGTVGHRACHRTSWGGPDYECSVTWSPDGTRVAFRKGETGQVTVFDATREGDGRRLDELTYFGWDGGWYQGP